MVFIPTATRNSSWIATKALSRLGKASVDNPPAAEDLALAIDQLDATVQNLQGRGVVYLGDLDSTPSGIADELADALAVKLKTDFGYNQPPGSDALPLQVQIDTNLRRLTADGIGYGPANVSFI